MQEIAYVVNKLVVELAKRKLDYFKWHFRCEILYIWHSDIVKAFIGGETHYGREQTYFRELH